MSLDYLIYALAGKLFIFFLQKFPFQKLSVVGRFFKEGGFLYDLMGCSLCLGFWVYLGLGFVFDIDFFISSKLDIVNKLLLACFTSLLVYLISNGWKSEFSVVVIE